LAAGDHGFDMKFSAEKAARKWPCGRSAVAMVTVAAVLWSAGVPSGPALAASRSGLAPWSGLFGESRPRPRPRRVVLPAAVPLPRPRPAEAPAIEPEPATAKQQSAPIEKPAEQAAAPVPPPPSTCRLALTDEIAIAPSIPDIHGPGGCGGEDLGRLAGGVRRDQHQGSPQPAARLRCKMAAAIADWVRSDVAPLASSLGSRIAVLDNFDAFECRSRNRIVG